MAKLKMPLLLFLLISPILSSLGAWTFQFRKKIDCTEKYRLNSFQDLKAQSVVSFAAVADMHGEGQFENINSAKAFQWIEKEQINFVLGLGDNDVSYTTFSLMQTLSRNGWWLRNYYPAIGDTEDQFFESQGPSCDFFGAQLYLKVLKLKSRAEVKISPDQKQYYFTKQFENINLHFVILYYTDVKHCESELFPVESKDYLLETINGIEKTENDIVIIASHSEYGDFIHLLPENTRKLVLSKADLILTGGLHYFTTNTNYENDPYESLRISCGSLTHARWGSPNGFIVVNVLKDPVRIILQYQDINQSNISLVDTPFAFVKYQGGPKCALVFK